MIGWSMKNIELLAFVIVCSYVPFLAFYIARKMFVMFDPMAILERALCNGEKIIMRKRCNAITFVNPVVLSIIFWSTSVRNENIFLLYLCILMYIVAILKQFVCVILTDSGVYVFGGNVIVFKVISFKYSEILKVRYNGYSFGWSIVTFCSPSNVFISGVENNRKVVSFINKNINID